jgi:hypothetical protein
MSRGLSGLVCPLACRAVVDGRQCVFVCIYNCSTYYKAVRVGTREEPGTLTPGGAPVFPGSSRLGMYVCIYCCSTYYKAVRVGGGG